MCWQPDNTKILRALQLDLLWTLQLRITLLNNLHDCVHTVDVTRALRRFQISKVIPIPDLVYRLSSLGVLMISKSISAPYSCADICRKNRTPENFDSIFYSQ